ncbi:MAG TPA: kelch repeat-containing protein [Polyangiaceae bacterium]
MRSILGSFLCVCVLAPVVMACSSDGSSSSAPPPAGAGAAATAGSGGQSAGSAGQSAGSAGQSGSGAGTAGSAGTATAELTWSTAAPCPVARFEANGVVIDGELWVMGGFTAGSLEVTRRVDIYDPVADSWRQGPDLPGAETHIAVVAIGNDIVVAGGFIGAFTGSRPPPTDTVFRLTAGTTEWTPGPSLPNAGAGFAWALVGSELHLAGGLFVDGNTDSQYHYVWDTAGADTWSMATELPNPRNHGGGAAAGGIFYAIGGRHGWDELAGNVANVEAFDPALGTWTFLAPLPVPRSEIGASTSTLSDGRILVVGGSMNGITPSDDVYTYQPSEDRWSSLPKLPEKRKGAVAFQVGDRIVVATGSPTSTTPSDTTFIGCCL